MGREVDLQITQVLQQLMEPKQHTFLTTLIDLIITPLFGLS